MVLAKLRILLRSRNVSGLDQRLMHTQLAHFTLIFINLNNLLQPVTGCKGVTSTTASYINLRIRIKLIIITLDAGEGESLLMKSDLTEK